MSENYRKPEKSLCLTFDDGPSATMEAVLDVLAKYDAKATFFVIGNRIAGNEAILQRAVREGHEIGNHSWSHQALGDLWDPKTRVASTNSQFDTAEKILAEIIPTQELVQKIAGVTPKLFRPPYLSDGVLFQKTVGMPCIATCADTVDYAETTTAEQIYDTVVTKARDGAIVLQHCFEGNEKTVEALKRILPWCIEHGYQMVTVSEMFRESVIVPVNGKYYRSVEQVALDAPYTR